MAGYAAGFSGLESFSPFCLFHLSLAVSFSHTIYLSSHSCASSLSRAVSLNSPRKSGKGDRDSKGERERKKERQTVRETSCSRFFGAGNVRPRRDPFNIAGASSPVRERDERERARSTIARYFIRDRSSGAVIIIGTAAAK